MTAIHLVTLLEALPVQETIEAIAELREMELPIGSVIVNRNIPAYLAPDDLAKAAEGDIDADAVPPDLDGAGITLSDNDFAGLLTETIEHATRIAARAESAEQLVELDVAASGTARAARRGRPGQSVRTGRSARPAGCAVTGGNR